MDPPKLPKVPSASGFIPPVVSPTTNPGRSWPTLSLIRGQLTGTPESDPFAKFSSMQVVEEALKATAIPANPAIGKTTALPGIAQFWKAGSSAQTFTSIDALFSPLGQGGIVGEVAQNSWLNISNYEDPNVLKKLASILTIHPLTVESIVDKRTRDKWEPFNEYFYLHMTVPRYENNDHDDDLDDSKDPGGVHLLLFRHLTVTLHQPALTSFMLRVVKKVEQRPAIRGFPPPDWILCAVMDTVVGAHEVKIKEWEDVAEEPIGGKEGLARLQHVRRNVGQYRRSLNAKRDTLFAISLHGEDLLSEKTRLYLRDTQSLANGMIADLEVVRDMAVTTHSTYLAELSLESSAISNQTNEVMKTISGGGAVLLPMSVIVGLFGMNVPVPGQESDSAGPFYLILLLLILMFGLSVLAFKRAGYL